MIKTVKFGGSSLACADQFKKAVEIVKSEKERLYVVPSAPGKRFKGDAKVTDMLYRCYALAEDGRDFSKALDNIRARYDEIVKGLGVKVDMDSEFQAIDSNFRSKKGGDYAASRGEYLNALIMAAALDRPFVDAADIVLFDEHGTFESERTNETARAKLKALKEGAVIPGFYGSLPDGSIHTFSRGGSDISGSIVARAVHSDVYENWTDVSGFLVADPGIIDDPVRIDTITYRELRELSYMGAGVLHEEAVFPVRREGIPVNIRNTNDPSNPGTWIVESTCQKSEYIITGIAGKKGFCAVNVDKDLMNTEVGFGRKVLQAFEDNGISFEHMPSGIDTMTVFVHQSEFMSHEQRVVAEIHRLAHPDSIEIESDLALIAVVGRGMRATRGTAGRIFSALAHASVNVKMIDQGSSELNIIIGVKNDDFEAAIRAIYDIFVMTRI